MGDNTANTNSKAPKKGLRGWFKGLKSEFKKIVWPDKDTLVKESAASIIITILLGVIIALVDWVIEHGFQLL